MDSIMLARGLHVLAIVVWIGGITMATTVVLPAVRAGQLGPDPRTAFHAIERRFVWQARTAVIVVGLTGLYMVSTLDLWSRFKSAAFWWMHAMVGTWLLFAFILFIAEPFMLQRHFNRWVQDKPDWAFAWLHRAHWLLLIFSLVTVFGAVAGSHG